MSQKGSERIDVMLSEEQLQSVGNAEIELRKCYQERGWMEGCAFANVLRP